MDALERATEVTKLFSKLHDLGITEYEVMVQFRGICKTFIKDGRPVRGQIPVPGTQRVVWYDFDDDRVDCVLK
jgi:hypothetical protein